MAADLETAHQALQKLKSHPEALEELHKGLASISKATGLDPNSDEFGYVANALVNQRDVSRNNKLAGQPGVAKVGSFLIKPSVE
jgi:hypothetical protein